jgi:ATP-dependent protease ClpP protease subunit
VPERGANEIIERQLDLLLESIEDATDADALTYIGPITYGIEDEIKYAVEDITNRRERLVVLLDTPGGYIEVAERIARTFRHHYDRVDFIVPGAAMSAGTVLVMSGNAIHMDYSSVLGPIDPQVSLQGSDTFIPALGYLEQYARLIEKSAKGTLTTAELTYLVQNFDPAELYRYEQERELSIALLKEWLVTYKFKDWTKTESRGLKVTKQMRTRRAGQIAVQLNKTGRWHSHSRGIPMELLRRELKLLIDDLDDNPVLAKAVRNYQRLLIDYMRRRGHDFALHRTGEYWGL